MYKNNLPPHTVIEHITVTVYGGNFMEQNVSKSVRYYLIAGLIFTAILGTLSHFFYEWSGDNRVIALFSPVNESTWEHMKLVFFPVLLWSLFMPPAIRKAYPSLRPALLAGNLIGTFLIPVLFYTYSGVLGRNVSFIDIAIFFIAVAAVFYTARKLKSSDRIYRMRKLIAALTVLLALAFFLFTFLPPDIGLFREP